MKIAIGSDHGGFDYKESIIEMLVELGHDVEDNGAYSKDSVDYPEIAHIVGQKVASGEADRGILICGSGIGVSIAANKVKGVRAALCENLYTARLSREHNDSNVLCLGQRVIGDQVALEIVQKWLKTDFAGGRHQRRVDMIEDVE